MDPTFKSTKFIIEIFKLATYETYVNKLIIICDDSLILFKTQTMRDK